MISVIGAWKSFPVTRDNPTLKEFIVRASRYLGGNREVAWALRDITFEVSEGECLGVIGRNGAGKSTLLSMLLGVMSPTKGTVDIKGRKTPLLALGAGFHPDMTGRENALLNGVLLGNSEDMVQQRMERIIEFAELGDYIDMPTRTYSSGMNMRLAFSVAIHTDPEILLIDEILAVGDEAFRMKSQQALKSMVKGGVTTVYVSHNMAAVRDVCTRVLWLDKAEIKMVGETNEVVAEYFKTVKASNPQPTKG